MKYKHLFPTYKAKSTFSIPFETLKNQGYETLIFDLDNTLLPDYELEVKQDLIKFKLSLIDLGFVVYIISNSGNKRVKYVSDQLELPYLSSARKPGTTRVSNFIKEKKINKDKLIWIGDQIHTDIAVANKLKVTSILVDPITLKEEFLTKINRVREKRKLKYFNKHKLYKEFE